MDDIKKENFIKKLTEMSKEEIDEFIKKKGKRPKPIPLIYYMER
ncbi:MAG: hypothetical protein PHC62_00755 [Candidatus Izemoplasmatales bacterium]|nr:hypothetical protein [Candidatus Izemoplasmatales bacterium]